MLAHRDFCITLQFAIGALADSSYRLGLLTHTQHINFIWDNNYYYRTQVIIPTMDALTIKKHN